jgi:hypothetical protein
LRFSQALNYDYPDGARGNNIAPTVTYAMDKVSTNDTNQGHMEGEVEMPGGSYEHVGAAEEANYKQALTALVAAKRTYKITVKTAKGMFAGTDAKIFLTLHDEAGNSSKEYNLSADLLDHSAPEGPPLTRLASQADKAVTFESGKTDYFFIEEFGKDEVPGMQRPLLGVLSSVTLRCEESGSATVGITTDASLTFRITKENFFDDWECEWVGVTDLSIGGATAGTPDGKTKQYSFPCSTDGPPAAKDFYQPGPLNPDQVTLPRDDRDGDPTRPITEDDETCVKACEAIMPTLRTGDVLLYLSAGWTAPYVLAVTGKLHTRGLASSTLAAAKPAPRLPFPSCCDPCGRFLFRGGRFSYLH